MKPIGATRWAIAEGYIPGTSTGAGRELVSHETLCILNAGDSDAHLQITVYYSNREPVGPFKFIVPAQRTRHLRINDFDDPEVVPVDTDFATIIDSDVPIIVQHTRLDTRQAALALLSTVALHSD